MSNYSKPIVKKGKKASKPSRRHLAMLRTVRQLALEKSQVVTPSDVRKQLAQNLQTLESSDMTHILGSLIKMNIVSKAEKVKSKRGRKPSIGNDNPPPGVKSYYQHSDYFEIIKKIISDNRARALIFFLLAESKLIHRFLYNNISLIMYIIKFDENALNTIHNAIYLKEIKMDFSELHEQLKNLDEKSLEASINIMAVKKTNELAKNIKDDDPILFSLFLFGGLYYYFN